MDGGTGCGRRVSDPVSYIKVDLTPSPSITSQPSDKVSCLGKINDKIKAPDGYVQYSQCSGMEAVETTQSISGIFNYFYLPYLQIHLLEKEPLWDRPTSI